MPSLNITPTAPTDGIAYATAVPLTTTELVLGDGLQVPAIIPTVYSQAVVAVVSLSIVGTIAANNSYVVMQTDLGDDAWVDMSWAFWNGTTGSVIFALSNGVAGANSVQQVRVAGAVPLDAQGASGNGANQLCLGGRLRFVGKGTVLGVLATIRYKLLGIR